jgi:hypothetical protein
MTICIATICRDKDDKEIIVFATDHMVSISNLGQFERTISKFKELNSNTIAMLSGDPLLFDTIIKGCLPDCDFDKMKETISKNIHELRDNTLQSQVLDIYKVSFDYIKDVLKGPIQNPYIENVIRTITEFSLETSILLIGFKDHKAQIVEIRENGLVDFRDIDFGAIGSGTVQAINTLLFQRQSKNDTLTTALYNLYKAKRNAEVSVGVGKETDMVILTDLGITRIESDEILILSKVYEDELHFGKNNDNIKEMVKALVNSERYGKQEKQI